MGLVSLSYVLFGDATIQLGFVIRYGCVDEKVSSPVPLVGIKRGQSPASCTLTRKYTYPWQEMVGRGIKVDEANDENKQATGNKRIDQ